MAETVLRMDRLSHEQLEAYLAGRAWEGKAGAFIDKVVGMGHHSVIEHASYTFSLEGVSRSLTHQLVRHRIASFSQQSQRYVSLLEPD